MARHQDHALRGRGSGFGGERLPAEQRDRPDPGEQQLRVHPADDRDPGVLVADGNEVALRQAGGTAGGDRLDAMSPIIDTGQTSWQNKHETYIQPVRRVLQAVNDPPQSGDPLQRYNAMTGTFRALIRRALRGTSVV